MKNNKGFAISGVLYPVFILFIALIFGIVGILASSKSLLDRIKVEIEMELNGENMNPNIVMLGNDMTVANGYTLSVLDGIKAYSFDGKEIGSERIQYSVTPSLNIDVNKNIDTTKPGEYIITYTATDNRGRATIQERILRVGTTETYEYAFVGDGQMFPLNQGGAYKVELWGAQGGDGRYNIDNTGAIVPGGRGAYASGIVNVPYDVNLGVFVGGKGGNNTPGVRGIAGFNGGGLGGSSNQGGAGGGGATDVRIMPKNSFRYIRDYASGSTSNTGNHWVEIEVYDINNVNIALNNTNISCFSGGTSLSVITDGLTASASYASCGSGARQWVEIDLGQEYQISRVNVRHYYLDSRTYYDTKTELYNASRSVKYTIFDSAWSSTYVEVASGRDSRYLEWNNFEGFKNRIIVASGGAGASNWTNAASGGAGGLISGFSGILNPSSVAHTLATGGSQNNGGVAGGSGANIGTNGRFGIGGNANFTTSYGSGAGGGYYGGGGGGSISGGVSSGSGGSSYISSNLAGYLAMNASATPLSLTHAANGLHYSGLVFTNTSMIAGNASMPNPLGGTQTGHSGNGYARITVLKKINS